MKLLYHVRSLPDRTYDRILFSCGLFLLLTECYKQCFLYFIIDKCHYDWWFFPFQLCSLPMYLCLLLPFLKHKSMKTAVCTFLQDFNLLGGLAALIVSEGFRGIHWTLTLHGYIWHLFLVFIGLFVFAGRRSDLCLRGYLQTLPLFLASCSIAFFINILAPGHGQADMFYISPYYPSTQPVFHEIAMAAGIIPANLLYLFTICLGAALVHFLFYLLEKHFTADAKS